MSDPLIGELVHELNQPLAAIVSFARGCVLRARGGNLSPETLETVMDDIVSEASRASALLRAPSSAGRRSVDGRRNGARDRRRRIECFRGVSSLLESAGFSITTYPRGDGFLGRYQGGAVPECVVLDLRMPRL